MATGSNTSKVLKVVANPAGTIWQGCNFLLTSSVQLTTTKTMTIDVLSSTPVTFLMKVNGGVAGAPEAAAQASHNGDGTWQTISFTFNTALDGKAATANGVYNNMVIHPFWTAGQTDFSGSPSARTARAMLNVSCVICMEMSQRRRSNLSARTPAKIDRNNSGPSWAKIMMPTREALPVRWYT